jgi:hypothetical protein
VALMLRKPQRQGEVLQQQRRRRRRPQQEGQGFVMVCAGCAVENRAAAAAAAASGLGGQHVFMVKQWQQQWLIERAGSLVHRQLLGSFTHHVRHIMWLWLPAWMGEPALCCAAVFI